MNVRGLISLHEGRVRHAYQDSLGFWTIGVGHLVDERKDGGLPEHIIDALLDFDIEQHAEAVFHFLPWVAQLDPVRQAVLIDMHFNLGNGLLKFKETLRQFQAGNWDAAADAMLDSLWAKQVGTRALRLSEMVKSGEWPND